MRNRDPLILLLVFVILIPVVAVATVVLSRSRTSPQLFHSPLKVQFLPVRTWALLPPIDDAHGSVAWSDLQWNYVVLIVTGDDAHGGALTPDAVTADQATLLLGSSWETQVTAKRDQLLVVNAAGGQQTFPLPLDGSVRVAGLKPLQEKITLVDELRKLLPESDHAAFDTLVSAQAPATDTLPDEIPVGE